MDFPSKNSIVVFPEYGTFSAQAWANFPYIRQNSETEFGFVMGLNDSMPTVEDNRYLAEGNPSSFHALIDVPFAVTGEDFYIRGYVAKHNGVAPGEMPYEEDGYFYTDAVKFSMTPVLVEMLASDIESNMINVSARAIKFNEGAFERFGGGISDFGFVWSDSLEGPLLLNAPNTDSTSVGGFVAETVSFDHSIIGDFNSSYRIRAYAIVGDNNLKLYSPVEEVQTKDGWRLLSNMSVCNYINDCNGINYPDNMEFNGILLGGRHELSVDGSLSTLIAHRVSDSEYGLFTLDDNCPDKRDICLSPLGNPLMLNVNSLTFDARYIMTATRFGSSAQIVILDSWNDNEVVDEIIVPSAWVHGSFSTTNDLICILGDRAGQSGYMMWAYNTSEMQGSIIDTIPFIDDFDVIQAEGYGVFIRRGKSPDYGMTVYEYHVSGLEGPYMSSEVKSRQGAVGHVVENALMYGLGEVEGEYRRDMWKLDLDSKNWTQVEDYPVGRIGAFTFDRQGKLALGGGEIRVGEEVFIATSYWEYVPCTLDCP